MGQTSSASNQPVQQIQKKPLSIFEKRRHNSYGQKRNQLLKTEEDEKNFNEEYTIVGRIKDDHLGDCVIMREKISNIKVCVKEITVQSREQMRYIQQNLLTNYNCYNNEDDEQESSRIPNSQFSTLAYPSHDKNLSSRRDESIFNNENNSQRKQSNNYHFNLVSVVRVVKAKDELDIFICSQSFRVLYALEYSELNLSNYFVNEQQSFNEAEIWQLIEQTTSALLYLQNQGKFHGDLSSKSIYIMQSNSCPHKKPGDFDTGKGCDCYLSQNQFKWYKVAENELVRNLSMYERISQQCFFSIKKNKGSNIQSNNEQNLKGIYLSPEYIDDINNQKYKSTNDAHKADVFSLGCVFLEVMANSLKKYSININLDDVFQYGLTNGDNFCKFNSASLKSKIDFIAQSGFYSDTLMNNIRNMVAADQFKRPDFKELALILQRIGKFNTPLNTQMIIKQSEALSSFNMTKSVQFNSLHSTSKLNPLTGIGNIESTEKIENVQSFLDCLQQMQQDQAKIQVESSDNHNNLFQYSPAMFKDAYLPKLDNQIITITPIQEINYTQEMMQQDVAEEDQQFSQKQAEINALNNIRLIPSTQRSSNKKLMHHTPNSKLLDYMNHIENKHQDENDTTNTSYINKSSRNDVSSLNTSILLQPKGILKIKKQKLNTSSRSILQENKSILNAQENLYERQYPNSQHKENTSVQKVIPKVNAYNKDVYAMIDANYRNNIINYQHRRSNSTYVQNQNQDKYSSPPQEYESVKKNSLVSYNSSTFNSSKPLSQKNDQKQPQYTIEKSASNTNINHHCQEKDFSSILSKETEKIFYNSNSSKNLYQPNSQFNSAQSVVPSIKQSYKSYIPTNNFDESKNLDNAIKQSNKIILNQRQQLIQIMQNNLSKPENLMNDMEYKYESIIPQNIPLPSDHGWRIQDSLPSHRSQSQKINTMTNNDRIKSVQIENYDLSFRDGSEAQLSTRNYSTNKLPTTQYLQQIPQNTNNSYCSLNSNQYLTDQPNQMLKQDPIIYENSVKIKKLSRNESLKDESELKIQDQSYKINKPYSSENISHKSSNTSLNITPRNLDQNLQKNTSSYHQMEQIQTNLVPPLNIDQLYDQKDLKQYNNHIYSQIGQNTESILDCSLLNDQKNSSITYNQQQLFTYSPGTIPSSTRNGCKRRTQSSFINDSTIYNQNTCISNNMNYINQYLNSSISNLSVTQNSNLHHQNTSNTISINNNYTVQPISSQVSEIISNQQFQKNQNNEQEMPFQSVVYNQPKQQFHNTHRPHKFELETVQELKESQFNQTMNLSAKKQTCQSALGYQGESINVVNTSQTPIKSSQNNITNNLQSAKNEKLSQSKMYENNILLQQHSPPQKNPIVVKEFLHKQEQDTKNTATSNIQKEYIYERYEDGAFYQGENWGTLRWGLGKFVYADGACYEGEWERGQMNGFGKLYYPSGNLAYEGKWKDDKFDGRGVIYNERPMQIKQCEEVMYQDFNKMTEEWTKFDGEFKMDEKVGFGTFYFSNSSKFQCTFVDDMAQGVGTFTFSDGISQVVGEWKQNILVNSFRQK